MTWLSRVASALPGGSHAYDMARQGVKQGISDTRQAASRFDDDTRRAIANAPGAAQGALQGLQAGAGGPQAFGQGRGVPPQAYAPQGAGMMPAAPQGAKGGRGMMPQGGGIVGQPWYTQAPQGAQQPPQGMGQPPGFAKGVGSMNPQQQAALQAAALRNVQLPSGGQGM